MNEMKTDGKQNNRGFSLVELVVVISIMAVFVGFVSVSAGVISGRQAREARDKLLSSLETVQAKTMGKYESVAELSYDDASRQYVLTCTFNKGTDSESTEVKVIGSNKCIIYYAVDALEGDVGTAEECAGNEHLKKIAAGSSVSFSFERSDGSLKEGADGYITHIYVVQGNHDPYGIRLYPETGKMIEE
jgi:prepilin-type N-terminal cleavage/methylation domain-containing protein